MHFSHERQFYVFLYAQASIVYLLYVINIVSCFNTTDLRQHLKEAQVV